MCIRDSLSVNVNNKKMIVFTSGFKGICAHGTICFLDFIAPIVKLLTLLYSTLLLPIESVVDAMKFRI